MLSGGIGRNDGLDASFGQNLAQAASVVGAIGQQGFGQMAGSQQTASAFEVVDVAGSDQQRPRAAAVVGQGVDFRGLPAARTADGVVEGPPFAPAAERWALM